MLPSKLVVNPIFFTVLLNCLLCLLITAPVRHGGAHLLNVETGDRRKISQAQASLGYPKDPASKRGKKKGQEREVEERRKSTDQQR